MIILSSKRYIQSLFFISLIFIVIGFTSGKISGESFTYISITESLIAILQIMLIVVVLMLGIVMTLPALIIDVLLIFIGWSFPVTSGIWNTIWDQLTLGWFWNTTSGSSILFSSFALAIIAFLLMRKK